MPVAEPAPAELVLFGLPRLLRDGSVLHVGSRKALALLAMLALDGAVPREQLAAVLWPDVDAAAARRNLRREVFRLRALGCLQRGVDGSLALTRTLSVDVQGFMLAMRAGDDAAALAVASSTLFDGLDGVAGPDADAWLARWRGILLSQRQSARQRHAQTLEQRGALDAALALLWQALAEDPCAEAATRHAMRLHAAMGDRAAGLALHARLAQSLQGVMAMTPDAETTALAAELRGMPAEVAATSDHALRPRATPALRLTADRLPFVGRSTVRQRIVAALAAGQRVYLSGAPGAGKTRLASECCAAQGAWLRVACAQDDVEQPYSSAVRALQTLLDAAPDVVLPEWVRRELAALLPEFGPAPAPVDSADAAGRLHAAFASAWQLLVHDNFNTVLLDDWQWGDPASVALWNRVDDSASPLRWIVAHRSAALPAAALQRMRRDVDNGCAVAVMLEGLDEDEALALVRALSGSAGGELFARRLHHATDGNPFFLLETLRHLFEQGRLHVADDGGWRTEFDEIIQDDAELPVPASVREAVLGRVRGLGEPARRLLEAASLAGDRFDLQMLDGITNLTAEQAVAVLEHAQAAQLLLPTEDGLRFAHDLVRQCLTDSLSPARRRLLHQGLAQRLAACGAAPAWVAQQHERAGQPGAAIEWRLRAAEAAWRVHALDDVEQQYGRALADGAHGVQAVTIHLALARLHRRGADNARSATDLAAAAHAAQEADAVTRLEVHLAIAQDLCANGRTDEALALLDALEADLAAAPARWRARALTLRSRMCGWRGQTAEAASLRHTAIALLDGVPEALVEQADLLDDAARIAAVAGDMASAEVWARRAMACYEAAGQGPSLAQASTLLGLVMLHGRNDRPAAEAAFDRARSLAARCGHVPAQRGAILNLVKLHTDAGRGDAALALLEEGEALAPGFEHQRAEQAFLAARYFVHYLRGQVPEASAAAGRLMALARRVADRRLLVDSAQMVADLFLHTGQLDAAAALLDEAEAVAAEGELRTAQLAAKRAWWWLASGHPAAALQWLDASAVPAHDEDRWVVGWIGAAAALALGDTQAARHRLAGLDIESETATHCLAMVLVQRLALARATGAEDPAAKRRAAALLLTQVAPSLEAAHLRIAFNAFSTPTS